MSQLVRAQGARTPFLAVAISASLIAGLALPGLAIARRRDSVEIISTRIVMEFSEVASFTICADEKTVIEASVKEEVVYRWTNEAPGTTHRSQRPISQGVTIRARSGAPGTATITPGSARATPPGGSAAFTVTGEDPGQAELYFDATGMPATNGLTVIVEECSYRISASAQWAYSGRGFNPTLFSNLSNLELKRQSQGDYFAVGTVHNSGYGVPVSGCQPVVTVSNTQILVRGVIVQGPYRQEIKLNLSWSTVPAGMTVTCPRVPGQGTSKDVAHIAVIDTNMKAWEFSDTKTVSGHLAESKLGTVSSDTFLVLTLVRP